MFPPPFDYFAPTTVDEALALLAEYGEDAKILAGGQSLLPMMKLRMASPKYVVDINRVVGLNGHALRDGRLVFGALCRHAEIAASPIVREHLPLMTDAANSTADVQVRNRGTIGGSLAHADPSGDWPTALMALDAVVTFVGPEGTRTAPLREFIVDAYTTQLAAGDVLTQVAVPLPGARSGGAYVKFERRAGDFAVASVAVQVEVDAAGRCQRAAVSLGALGATAVRVPNAERLLSGHMVSEALGQEASREVVAAAQPFEDTRGSVEYKRHLAGVLFHRALTVAVDRAHGRQVETLHP